MAISEKKYKSLLARMRTQRASSREMVRTVVDTMEVGASTGVHSFVDGYFGGVAVLGVPLPLITGTLMHGMGAFGLLSEDMHALGNGAYASTIAQWAADFGREVSADAPAQAAASGRRFAIGAGGGRLSDAQLRALALA